MGEVFLAQQKVVEAEDAYRWATRLGPPGAEVAYFMLGQCHESQGRDDEAVDSYLSALRIDPGAVSAAQRLSKLLDARPVLQHWGRTCLQELAAKASERVPRYKQEVLRGHAGAPGL